MPAQSFLRYLHNFYSNSVYEVVIDGPNEPLGSRDFYVVVHNRGPETLWISPEDPTTGVPNPGVGIPVPADGVSDPLYIEGTATGGSGKFWAATNTGSAHGATFDMVITIES